MCQQAPDHLNMNDEAWFLWSSFPIESLLDTLPFKPRFHDSCSALYRGVIATWSVENDRLYLLALQDGIQKGRPSALPALFPDNPPPILAKWFTGNMHLTRGEEVAYRYPYMSDFEHEAYVTVKDGVVTATKFIQREKLLPGQQPADYSSLM